MGLAHAVDNTAPPGCLGLEVLVTVGQEQRALAVPCVRVSAVDRGFHGGKEESGWENMLEAWPRWTSMQGMQGIRAGSCTGCPGRCLVSFLATPAILHSCSGAPNWVFRQYPAILSWKVAFPQDLPLPFT